MEAKLSADQRGILKFLLDRYEAIEQDGNEYQRSILRVWGVDWALEKPDRAQSAALSRSLRRLEDRGLVQRVNGISGGKRTTNVLLTPKGREVAKRLTSS